MGAPYPGFRFGITLKFLLGKIPSKSPKIACSGITIRRCSSTGFDTKGVIYEKKPVKMEVIEGKVYAWCACGRSKNQPFCDGTHRVHPTTGEKLVSPFPIQSVKYKAEATKSVFFCNCKQTSKLPFCDGTHKKL